MEQRLQEQPAQPSISPEMQLQIARKKQLDRTSPKAVSRYLTCGFSSDRTSLHIMGTLKYIDQEEQYQVIPGVNFTITNDKVLTIISSQCLNHLVDFHLSAVKQESDSLITATGKLLINGQPQADNIIVNIKKYEANKEAAHQVVIFPQIPYLLNYIQMQIMKFMGSQKPCAEERYESSGVKRKPEISLYCTEESLDDEKPSADLPSYDDAKNLSQKETTAREAMVKRGIEIFKKPLPGPIKKARRYEPSVNRPGVNS